MTYKVKGNRVVKAKPRSTFTDLGPAEDLNGSPVDPQLDWQPAKLQLETVGKNEALYMVLDGARIASRGRDEHGKPCWLSLIGDVFRDGPYDN